MWRVTFNPTSGRCLVCEKATVHGKLCCVCLHSEVTGKTMLVNNKFQSLLVAVVFSPRKVSTLLHLACAVASGAGKLSGGGGVASGN